MSALDAQIGPYLYSSKFIDRRTFGVDRGLTILIAGAYDTGIIGSERNGIVILDDDNDRKVLEEHFREDSGWFGPTARQVAEFERLRAMDWKQLGEFVRSHPGYLQGAAPDLVSGARPQRGDLATQIRVGREVQVPAARDIRTRTMQKLHADEKGGYAFPLKTRVEILAFLGGHRQHDYSGHDFALAWNVKAGGADFSGKGGPEAVDARFDALWEKVAEKDDVFCDACESGLRPYVEGEYTTFPGNDQGKYGFGVAGAQGGWIVLTEFHGDKAVFRSPGDLRDWIAGLRESRLVNLYKLVGSLDADLSRKAAVNEVSHQFNFLRSNDEAAWLAEPLSAVERAIEVKLGADEVCKLALSLGVACANVAGMLVEDGSLDDDEVFEALAPYGEAAVAAAREASRGPTLNS